MIIDKRVKNDVVNPQHYKICGVECIDIIISTQGREAAMDFCVCNAIKYLYRQSKKGGIDDIRKAHWYLEKYLELEGENDPGN